LEISKPAKQQFGSYSKELEVLQEHKEKMDSSTPQRYKLEKNIP
jgi:hypothetical protein